MKQAAGVLDVTARTVAFHKYKMMKALHLENTADLLRFAIRSGFVSQ